jgi:hypothetical protein
MSVNDLAPEGHPHTETVAASIIGCWMEMNDARGKVLYRRFLHYLPLNLPTIWHEWSMLKRKNARFYVDLPALEAAYELALYEQKYASPCAALPSRYCHFTCAINAKIVKANAHTEFA